MSVKERAERDVSSPSLEVVLSRAEGPSSCSCFAPQQERRPSQRRKGPELGLCPGSALRCFSPGSAVRHAVGARFPQLIFV